MTRFILRTALTTLALVMLFAGSFNLSRSSAQEEFELVANDCVTYTGCAGGPIHCGSIDYPNGSTVNCGMK